MSDMFISLFINYVRSGSQKKETQEDAAQDMKPAGKKKQEMTQEDVAKFEHELELVKVASKTMPAFFFLFFIFFFGCVADSNLFST